MTIYNVTFMMERSLKARFTGWLRARRADGLLSEEKGVVGASLQEVVEVPGESEFAEQALSVALQAKFIDRTAAHAWGRSALASLLADYRKDFGPEALSFSTILETIDLE